ncbi:histidine kinase dimerization/phosphoacceptor domain -containing protein [Mucilaginibacter sabulilitoris]|uniref:histidine kinase n=1 Tax=Mucilaginibacter sabulilitoris TaxID=1173583 RepID=A0ABZ0TEF5_9SPHI|nr:histidine kinase dimerization/phosphoacceptor domain -containing protein [Mucilaginibacter sabulilitoris]WPU91575.1 histidine kinase dimerization/phosphoacceptor domain -containing protein [Mucilaginibacter sabulilitoris]
MKRCVFIILILSGAGIVRGQDETHNISRLEANNLLKSLNQKNVDTVRIDQLLRLALFNILKPGEQKADLDSAGLFIKKAESISGRVKSPAIWGYMALVKANFYRENGQKEQGKKFAEKAVALLKNTSDKYHLGSAYLELAHHYEFNDPKQVGEKMHLVERAVTALEYSKHTELKAYSLQFLADLYSTQSLDAKALPIIKRAIEAYQSIHYKKLQGAYHVYSALCYDLSDYENALTYELKALKVAEELKDSVMIGTIYNGLGMISDSIHDRENAKKYYKLALENAQRRHDLPAIGYILQNIVIDYDYLNQNKEALNFINSLPERDSLSNLKGTVVSFAFLVVYSRLNQPVKAEFYIDKLQKYIDLNHPTPLRVSRLYARFVRYYTDTHQFTKAKFYLKKVDSIDRAVNDHFTITWDYVLKAKLDSAQGNYKAALFNLSKFNTLHDSLLNETKSRQLKQIQVIYETEKRLNEIKLKDQNIRLLNQNSEIQSTNLLHAQHTKNWIFAGSCMLLIIAGLLYWQGAIRKKNNVTITQKNKLLQHLLTEKEWLLKEVHHRVKNNLHTVICLLESQARYLEDDALAAIENSQHRIYAMSLIHQKLYQSDDIKTINMATYIPELVQTLENSFDTAGRIEFKLNVEPVNLSLSHAIPLGLIINEAVTNSIKYAFPNNKKGEISISMKENEKQIILELADDGIGMPQIDHDTEPESLGLRLIKGLGEDIDAEISFYVDNGTLIVISFKPDLLNDPEHFLKSSTETLI